MLSSGHGTVIANMLSQHLSPAQDLPKAEPVGSHHGSRDLQGSNSPAGLLMIEGFWGRDRYCLQLCPKW